MESDIQNLQGLISDPQRRNEAIAALEEYVQAHPEDENLPTLNELRDKLVSEDVFIPASDTQLELLQSILGNSFSPQPVSFFRPPAIETPSTNAQISFLERENGDNLGSFIDRNLEYLGFGRDVPREERARLVRDFLEHTTVETEEAGVEGQGRRIGIRFGSVKLWGSSRGDGEFVEPRSMTQVLKVYEWFDAQALKHGKRIDVWDFLATIYPPVREMLHNSASTNGEIVMRVPRFMEKLNFEHFSYATFALAAKNSGLITEIPDGTVGHHVREEVERPRWETLARYADIISGQANGDDDVHRRQIFDFLVFLRLLPVLSTTATAKDMADRSLTRPADDYRSRYTIRVVPESELVEYLSFGDTARFSIQRWPFSDIASGHFDRMLEMLGRRIEALETFSTEIAADSNELVSLKTRLAEIKEQHAIHRSRIIDPTTDPSHLTLEYLNEVRSFYGQLDRFFKQTLFFTHARGSVSFGKLTIPFEIVPQIDGVQTSPVVDGRITVFADDILARGTDVNTLFNLRLLTTWHSASGITDESDLEDAQKIYKLAKGFDLGLTDSELLNAAQALAELNKAAKLNTNGSIDPTLHRAVHLHTTGGVEQRAYYVYDFSEPWQEHLAQFYNEQGYSEDAIYFDAEIVENYFKAVRHPHYIFNSSKLDALIRNDYGNEADAEQARGRILNFLRHINIRTEPVTHHPLSPDDTSPQLKAIEWAFRDYLENFPGANELGAKIEINERLLSEVVDRQIAEHPGVHLRKGIIKRGVISAINRFNEGRTQNIEQITEDFYPLPNEGIFPQRFYAFLEKWGGQNYGPLSLERQKLLLAFSLIKDNSLSFDEIDRALIVVGAQEALLEENSSALFDWGVRLRQEIELFEKLASPDAVEKYLRDNYDAMLISAQIASQLTIEYLKLRLTTPQPVNLDNLIIAAVGDRFDPYPTVKAEVVAFYHIFIRDYLNNLYEKMRAQHDATVKTIDKVATQMMADPAHVIHGVSGKDFEKKILSALGLLPAEPTDSGDPLRRFQYHPSLQKVKEFDEQTRLLAEALGKPLPINLQEYISRTYSTVADATLANIEAQHRRIVEEEHQMILAEVPINHFWKRVEKSLAVYSGQFVNDNMGSDEIDSALRNIDEGLNMIAGFETEINSTVLTEWARAAELAQMLSDNDEATEIMHKAESLIAETKNRLEEQQLLLQIRLEELGELETRRAADEKAREIMGRAEVILVKAETNTKNLSDLIDRIKKLSDEMKGFSHLLSQQTVPTLATSQSQWTLFEGYRNRITALRTELDGLRTQVESISPTDIHGQIVAARDTLAMSDAVKAELSSARVNLVHAISEMNGTLEQAEMAITRLGGSFTNVQNKLYKEEKEIPPPSFINVPVSEGHLTQSVFFDDQSIVSFNTSSYTGTSKGKINKIIEEIAGAHVLAVGDRSYMIGSGASAVSKTWINSERSSELTIEDVFGRTISIEPGARGVRLFDRTETEIPLIQKMNIALEAKNYETDFIARLFEAATRNEVAGELWQQFLLEMVGEDIRSHQDAVLFVRRFAIAYKGSIDLNKMLSKNNWFVKERSPIQIELSQEEQSDLLNRTFDQISSHVRSVHGVQNEELVRTHTVDLAIAMESNLSSRALAWWKARETEGIPGVLGVLWGILAQGYNKDLLQKIFLSRLSAQIENDVGNGGDLLPADFTSLMRSGLRFIMENIIEIRFGNILYEKGKLLYDFKHHRENAELTKIRLAHPELKTVVFSSQYNIAKRRGLMVPQTDYDRLVELGRTSSRGKITFDYFNVDTDQMETTTLDTTGVRIGPSPADVYAHLLYEIFNEPRLLALGFMISSISSLVTIENPIYQSMIGLLKKYDMPANEPESSKIRKLIDLEREIELLYRRYVLKENIEPTEPAPPAAHPNAGISIEAFLDDNTSLTLNNGASVITGFTAANETFGFGESQAMQAIKIALEQNLAGFQDLSHDARQNMVNAMVNMAKLRPGEPITVTQQALTTYYTSMGMTPPATIQSFVIPNFFIMNTLPFIH